MAGSYTKVKRDAKPRSKHRIRRDISIEEHHEAMAEVWTGKGGVTPGGDAIMIP